MKVIILAAGYATRLQNDLEKEEYRAYRHLMGTPKALLPVPPLKPLLSEGGGDRPLLLLWLQLLRETGSWGETKVYVVTNQLYHQKFQSFLRCSSFADSVTLLNDGTTSNDTRRGAAACLHFADSASARDAETLVIAGDTLLHASFVLGDLMAYRREVALTEGEAVSVIVSAPVDEEEVSKHGILESDQAGRVRQFLEKPLPSETPSRRQSPCVYLLSSPAMVLLEEFLRITKDDPLKSRDATGHFISYLTPRLPVYHYSVTQRFDIGNMKSYLECCQSFKK